MQELRESVQLLLTQKIAVYLMTFLIVTVAWAAHIRSDLINIRYNNSIFKVPYVSLPVLQIISSNRAHRRLSGTAESCE